MTTFLELCESTDDVYKCDECGKTFKAGEVKLEKAPTNLKILTPLSPFIFVDKDGAIKKGGTGAEEGDRMLACPHCNSVHPFGFNLIQ